MKKFLNFEAIKDSLAQKEKFRKTGPTWRDWLLVDGVGPPPGGGGQYLTKSGGNWMPFNGSKNLTLLSGLQPRDQIN